jgi:hypothetical protein
MAYLKPCMHDGLLNGVYIWRYVIYLLQKRRKANGVHGDEPQNNSGVLLLLLLTVLLASFLNAL